MLPALPLITALVVGAPSRCFLVTNHEIVIVPACDFSPAAIATLSKGLETDEPGASPGAPPPAREPYRGPGYGRAPWRGGVGWQR